jgi:hypothetical protein
LLKKLDELIVEMSAKYKFIKLIVEEKLIVMKVSDEELLVSGSTERVVAVLGELLGEGRERGNRI